MRAATIGVHQQLSMIHRDAAAVVRIMMTPANRGIRRTELTQQADSKRNEYATPSPSAAPSFQLHLRSPVFPQIENDVRRGQIKAPW
jgi:hypothetical protein